MESGVLLGRSGELDALLQLIDGEGPAVCTITGPRGRGKTALLAQALRGREALHFQAADLTEGDLVHDFGELAKMVFGETPVSRRRGVLPLQSGSGRWRMLLSGLLDQAESEATPRPLVVVLDGMGALLAARRRFGEDLAEVMESARARRVPFILILTARDEGTLDPVTGPNGRLGPADLTLSIPALPYRVAGWAHGGQNSRDAFLRWALFGDHPAHLPSRPPDSALDEAVISRVLQPDGDLFEAPLRRLESTFQRPGRYAAILRTLARGPLDWSGILEGVRGIDSGGQLAPYLRRLEEEGLVRVTQPLDARSGSRSRRYAVADPFLAFWFAWVLPHRDLFHRRGPRAVWAEIIRPSLDVHLQQWLEVAARRWMREHADELLGAPAREAGGLWGGEAEFPVVGRLANGQVCYGLVAWEAATDRIAVEMRSRMEATRYGIGREARRPLFFLGEQADPAVRRLVARRPLSRIVDVDQIMGPEIG